MNGFAEQYREQRLIYSIRDPDTLDLNTCSAAAALSDGARQSHLPGHQWDNDSANHEHNDCPQLSVYAGMQAFHQVDALAHFFCGAFNPGWSFAQIGISHRVPPLSHPVGLQFKKI